MFWFSVGICSPCAEGVDGPGVEAGSVQEPARRAVSGGTKQVLRVEVQQPQEYRQGPADNQESLISPLSVHRNAAWRSKGLEISV